MFAGTFFLGGECSYSPVCRGLIGITGQITVADFANINEAVFRNATPFMPHYPELLRISDSARPEAHNTDTFICDEIKMRSNLEFRNRFQFTRAGYSMHLDAINSVQSSLEDLRLALQDVLEKSPPASDE